MFSSFLLTGAFQTSSPFPTLLVGEANLISDFRFLFSSAFKFFL